ncbi:CRISPR-associated primase-polymerase type B [Mangrovibacterium sp.]|uniref:CRISPR-associated primase-polymerase type B n=1 Tax=Mangrovibacterium sp. TaxID=1961364 RepID=UPI00356B1798
MLQAGKSITQANDPMVKVQPDYLYHAVCHPKPAIEAAIRQLRNVRHLDQNSYRSLKKQLPYVTCGVFNPPYRKTENFAWINHFILDIDHLSDKERSIESMRETLSADSRVKLLFTSPGEDGLKILFQLSEKCFDANKYSIFYKVFAQKFSARYGLEQLLDKRTSDVTRACFVSVDPEAFYRADCEMVRMEDYVDFNNPFEVQQIDYELKSQEKAKAPAKTEPADKEPADDSLAEIKARLNPRYKLKAEKQIFVPDEIESVIEQIINQMHELGIETTEQQNIHYGKKFRFRLGNKEAEINLFYGKRGFSVVQSPRRGTHSEFNGLCAQAIAQLVSPE